LKVGVFTQPGPKADLGPLDGGYRFQNNSGLPQGLADPLCGRLTMR
jgi:hypothetical protein